MTATHTPGIEYDSKVAVWACSSYIKHFGPHALAAAERDAIREMVGLLREFRHGIGEIDDLVKRTDAFLETVQP